MSVECACARAQVSLSLGACASLSAWIICDDGEDDCPQVPIVVRPDTLYPGATAIVAAQGVCACV
jgi:hypothetical protein